MDNAFWSIDRATHMTRGEYRVAVRVAARLAGRNVCFGKDSPSPPAPDPNIGIAAQQNTQTAAINAPSLWCTCGSHRRGRSRYGRILERVVCSHHEPHGLGRVVGDGEQVQVGRADLAGRQDDGAQPVDESPHLRFDSAIHAGRQESDHEHPREQQHRDDREHHGSAVRSGHSDRVRGR